jgi:hypothetical protein
MERRILLLLVAFGLWLPFVFSARAAEKKLDVQKIYGRIQFVQSFPDYKVKSVKNFADLKVQIVKNFPDAPGQWQIVNSSPDFKIQVVDSSADFTVEFKNGVPEAAQPSAGSTAPLG